MMTLAVPSKSASPVTPSVLEAVIVVAATAPVTLPVTAPTKPLVEVTGPEKVVELIGKSSHASYGAYLSACRQSGNCQISRFDSGFITVYTSYSPVAQIKKPVCGDGPSLFKGDKHTKNNKKHKLFTAKLQHPQHIT
jgi:hypothetical protein